jgi:O-antigen ligase
VRIIAGAHEPDDGEIRFVGQLVYLRSPAAAQAHGVAIIYQEPTLFPDLSVAENVMMGRQPTVEEQAARADSAGVAAAKLLREGTWFVRACALVMLAGVFLPWVSISRAGASTTINGLSGVTYLAGALTLLCTAGLLALTFNLPHRWTVWAQGLMLIAPALLAVGAATRVTGSVDVLNIAVGSRCHQRNPRHR